MPAQIIPFPVQAARPAHRPAHMIAFLERVAVTANNMAEQALLLSQKTEAVVAACQAAQAAMKKITEPSVLAE